MGESRNGGERRRVFGAEFKLEAVRRMEERRAGGVNLTQIGRELGVRPDQLRKWKRQHEQRAGAAAADVFPGQGRLPAEERALVFVDPPSPRAFMGWFVRRDRLVRLLARCERDVSEAALRRQLAGAIPVTRYVRGAPPALALTGGGVG
jgi:transposase-like protein